MSDAEDSLLWQIKAAGLPLPEREVKFHPERRWRMDFLWPERKLALEVHGAVWTGGRHTTGAGMTKDCEKFSAAAIMGYRLIQCTTAHVKSGIALEWVKKALEA